MERARKSDSIDAREAGLDYLAMPEADREAVLLRELATARPLVLPFAHYSAETSSELSIFRAAADGHARYGLDCVRNVIISNSASVSDLLEVAVLCKETGLLRDGLLNVNIVPLFETIGDLQCAPDVMARLFALQPYRNVLRNNTQEIMV